MPKTVHIEYYAFLREAAGLSEERWSTEAGTAAELYAELRERYGFTIETTTLRAAINEEFVDWTAPLSDGDNVVFIPPVAGG